MIALHNTDKTLKTSLFLIVFLLWFLHQKAGATDIVVSGGWSTALESPNAGHNFQNLYDSSENSVVIDISSPMSESDPAWAVYIQRLSGDWFVNAILEVTVTSCGTGGQVYWTDGTYIPVTTGNTVFFTGKGSPSGINIQFRLSGISIEDSSLAPGQYNAGVTFSVQDM